MMKKWVFVLPLVALVPLGLIADGALVSVGTSRGVAAAGPPRTFGETPAQSVNPVVQWNRTLLVIVRTPKAQPATVHPTRSLAIMHAAIYDAVNAIDRGHRPYFVRLTDVSRGASQDAAAAAAAHDVLVALYPSFSAALDAELQASLTGRAPLTKR
jgi:hypothetical protein